MYLSCRLRSLCAVYNRPGTDFLRTCRQEADIAEEMIACPYERVKTTLLYAEVGKERLFVVAVKLGKLRLDLGAYADELRSLALCKFGELFYMFRSFQSHRRSCPR